MAINKYQTNAYVLRHQMNLRNGMKGSSNNPQHGEHINEFCDYADNVVAAAMEDLRQETLLMIKQEFEKEKAHLDVDENSFQ
ncbi:MAG: hypothetical protein GX096_06040 [Clostridiales bacterium]|nr:hypothetical protein [Clostridiales bacterium]